MRKSKNSTILIVDENPYDLRQLRQALTDFGEIFFATSGASGLEMAVEQKPDLILIDYQLSDINGVEFCRQLKKDKETHEISVVIMAREDYRRHEVAALEAGAADFIDKPINFQVIRARVKTHLNALRDKNLLRLLADKDGLTEVYNRRYFETQSRIELKRHYRQQHSITLALLDIDHFKQYNDVYGHLQGDVCLREVARAIQQCTRRPGEFIARYGGEEFAAILPNTDIHNAKKYGQWICDKVLSLAVPHSNSATVPFVSISVGLATVVPTSRTTLENLIATADSALYLAKESGRNQFKVATIEQETIREAG